MPDKLYLMGMDVGFRKTGYSIFEMGPVDDDLIFATTLLQEKDDSKTTSSVQKDIFAIYDLLDGLDAAFNKWHPAAVFCEIPHGGSQGARAGRCMGIATALIVTYLRQRKEHYELYTPGEVELNLGVKLAPQVAKKKGLKKGEATKWKKERLAEIVIRNWPLFDGWPERAAEAEDAIDSAAAFISGRVANNLYKRIKDKLNGR